MLPILSIAARQKARDGEHPYRGFVVPGGDRSPLGPRAIDHAGDDHDRDV
ncbi:MAG: hypothetical protein AAFX76_10300 [Planctomycetota bacterium]